MGCQVRLSRGHDIFYLPSQARPGGEGERTTGGYYVNAAQAGEAPGRWFGTGAAALGLAEGAEVDPAVHEMVFSQVDPRDGKTTLGRAPAKDTAEKRAEREAELARLLAAEPHATEARKHELERQAAQMHRTSRAVHGFDRGLFQVGQRRPRLYQGKRPAGGAGRGPGGRGLVG